jgi:Arc/MetJ-type ribon-helix-helix transcriptional regulator
MREVITISLPKETRQMIKKRIKERGLKGMSEYVRYLLELDTDVIPQDELLAMAAKAKKAYARGKLKPKGTLADIK